jgi:hypothetical protein
MTISRLAFCLTLFFIFLGDLYAQDSLQYRFDYHCKGERIVVDHCRHDSDQPGFAPTKPEDDYCQVYFNLAIVYTSAGQKDLAMRQYTILKTLDPDRAAKLLTEISGAK